MFVACARSSHACCPRAAEGFFQISGKMTWKFNAANQACRGCCVGAPLPDIQIQMFISSPVVVATGSPGSSVYVAAAATVDERGAHLRNGRELDLQEEERVHVVLPKDAVLGVPDFAFQPAFERTGHVHSTFLLPRLEAVSVWDGHLAVLDPLCPRGNVVFLFNLSLARPEHVGGSVWQIGHSNTLVCRI